MTYRVIKQYAGYDSDFLYFVGMPAQPLDGGMMTVSPLTVFVGGSTPHVPPQAHSVKELKKLLREMLRACDSSVLELVPAHSTLIERADYDK
jgi:glutaminase